MSALGRPAIDAGIVASDGGTLVVATARGLADAGERYDLRIVFRDNGSSDGTADALARDAPEVIVDRAPVDSGAVAGVNALLRLSDAPWFLVLAPGVVPAADAIDRLVQAAEAHPRAAAVVPRIVRPDGPAGAMGSFPSLRSAAAQFLRPAGVASGPDGRSRRGVIDRRVDGAPPDGAPGRVAWATLDTALLRRRAVTSVGFFDERFSMGMASLDWCWRAAERGWDVWLEPAAVVSEGAGALLAAWPERGAIWRWYRDTHRPVAAHAFRWLSTAGAVRGAMAAKLSRRPDMERYWREVLAAYRS